MDCFFINIGYNLGFSFFNPGLSGGGKYQGHPGG
jgi:hypothetical protein